jgi:hypothetical protein
LAENREEGDGGRGRGWREKEKRKGKRKKTAVVGLGDACLAMEREMSFEGGREREGQDYYEELNEDQRSTEYGVRSTGDQVLDVTSRSPRAMSAE